MSILAQSYYGQAVLTEDIGVITAKISGTKVTVTAISLNDSSVKISVKARKFGMPKISVSQNVFVKIMSYLNE